MTTRSAKEQTLARSLRLFIGSGNLKRITPEWDIKHGLAIFYLRIKDDLGYSVELQITVTLTFEFRYTHLADNPKVSKTILRSQINKFLYGGEKYNFFADEKSVGGGTLVREKHRYIERQRKSFSSKIPQRKEPSPPTPEFRQVYAPSWGIRT